LKNGCDLKNSQKRPHNGDLLAEEVAVMRPFLRDLLGEEVAV